MSAVAFELYHLFVASLAQNYPTPVGYTGDFLNKNNAVIAFMVLNVIANAISAWISVEWALSGKAVGVSFLPQRGALLSIGTSLCLSAASVCTSFLAWVIYSSTVADDRAYFGGSAAAAAYPGGAEVVYSAGFGLVVTVWLVSIVCVWAYAQAVLAARAEARVPCLAAAGAGTGDFEAMRLESNGAGPDVTISRS